MVFVNILCYTDGKSEVIRLVEMAHKERILRIYEALQEKGYNPVGQIVGYILTEDPTYITNYNGARNLASRIDREELLKDIVLDYFEGMIERVVEADQALKAYYAEQDAKN